MSTIKTTTLDFKDGLAVRDDQPTIAWESTGHLHVRLMDELGQAPVAAYLATVDIPGQGTVELTSNRDGVVLHEHVPFQDYELRIDGGYAVHAPAVATLGEQQERHVPGLRFAFANLFIGDALFEPLANQRFTLEGPATIKLYTDAGGMTDVATPLPVGAYELVFDGGRVPVALSSYRDAVTLVSLPEQEESP